MTSNNQNGLFLSYVGESHSWCFPKQGREEKEGGRDDRSHGGLRRGMLGGGFDRRPTKQPSHMSRFPIKISPFPPNIAGF